MGLDRRKLNRITWVFVALAVALGIMMLGSSIHRPGTIVLPDPASVPDQSGDSTGFGDRLTVVEVTPETVQAAVETLKRPERYRRSVTVEHLWSGGSVSYEVTVAAVGPWTRTDRTMPDGRVRHTITGAETVSIWYNSEHQVYTAPVGTIIADHEQPIPTYEEILTLETERITAADYREASGIPCIYVEAEEGDYVLRYWVSVETGLLAAAEKLLEGEAVYRMASLTVDQVEPSAADFTLPDGTVLLPLD